MNLPHLPNIPGTNLAQARGLATRFFTWARSTLDTLCERPDHLQRLAIIGAGMVMFPTVLGIIYIVWRGYERTPELQSQSLNIMGFALYGAMALWGLVVIALLGIVKGLRIEGPGGIGIDIQTTADDPDVGPETTRDIHIHERHGHGPDLNPIATVPTPTPPAGDAKQPPTVSD
jgi:F0F1-type ATP synthase membrane subunit c/vacuolar-type H+-ATPase subunit K